MLTPQQEYTIFKLIEKLYGTDTKSLHKVEFKELLKDKKVTDITRFFEITKAKFYSFIKEYAEVIDAEFNLEEYCDIFTKNLGLQLTVEEKYPIYQEISKLYDSKVMAEFDDIYDGKNGESAKVKKLTFLIDEMEAKIAYSFELSLPQFALIMDEYLWQICRNSWLLTLEEYCGVEVE